MYRSLSPINRHKFLQTTALPRELSPRLRCCARRARVKIGVLHPVTGALAYSGQQCRMARCSLSRRSTLPAASSRRAAPRSRPCWPTRNPSPTSGLPKSTSPAAGVLAISGPIRIRYRACDHAGRRQAQSSASRRRWRRRQIVTRGLPNTFRFAPGFGKITGFALDALQKINTAPEIRPRPSLSCMRTARSDPAWRSC